MDEAITVNAEVRNRVGKGGARAQRRAGRVPAVIYGDKQDPVMISLEGREVDKLIQSPQFFTQIFDVGVGGKKHKVLARDLQLHPVTDRALHIDFLRFNENTRIVLSIPVVFRNEESSPGLKRGGVLNIVRREVELLCSPLNIPGELSFDLDGLDIGDAIHIRAIELPEGVATTTDRDFTVATIAAPTIMPVEEEHTEEDEGEDGEEGEGVTGSESTEAAVDTNDADASQGE